jgi:hypothetical protein
LAGLCDREHCGLKAIREQADIHNDWVSRIQHRKVSTFFAFLVMDMLEKEQLPQLKQQAMQALRKWTRLAKPREDRAHETGPFAPGQTSGGIAKCLLVCVEKCKECKPAIGVVLGACV